MTPTLRPAPPRRLAAPRVHCPACQAVHALGSDPDAALVCPECGHVIVGTREAQLRRRLAELEGVRRETLARIEGRWSEMKVDYSVLDRNQSETYDVLALLRECGGEMPGLLEFFEEDAE